MPVPGCLQGGENRADMGFPCRARCRGKGKLLCQLGGAAQSDEILTSYPSPHTTPQMLLLKQAQIKTAP